MINTPSTIIIVILHLRKYYSLGAALFVVVPSGRFVAGALGRPGTSDGNDLDDEVSIC